MMLASVTKPMKVSARLSYRVAMRRHCLMRLEEAFDAVSLLAEGFVVGVLALAMTPWRDDGIATLVDDETVEPVCVVGLVG